MCRRSRGELSLEADLNVQLHLLVTTYVSAENVVVQSLFEGVVSDELAVRLRPGDALAAGRVDGDDSVLGNVEVGRGLGASLDGSSICAYLLSCISPWP